MFGEEFVKAYERQVAEYQRHDRDGTSAGSSQEPTDQAADPGLMETQILDAPEALAEAAFEADDVVDALSESSASEIDQSFIDELDNSMSEAISEDQLKA